MMTEQEAHAGAVAGPDLASAARQLAELLDAPAGGTRAAEGALAAVAAAAQVSRLADSALRVAVDRARDAGQTWQQIGEILGTTRQAAFQRFGHPIDPRTGTQLPRQTLPGAGEHAIALFTDWSQGHWEQVRADFDKTMREKLTADGLAAAWAQVAAMAGAYQHMGEPFVRRQADYTVVDLPLEFEAGAMKGRVTYNGDGQVAGLFILVPQAP